jgi:hypothetical protein
MIALSMVMFDGQLPVPGQDGVRPGLSCDFAENHAAQAMTDLTEPGSHGVRGPQSPFQLGRMPFSAARYSFRASSSWSTVPVT